LAILNLDLVVSVDTAVGHLGGVLGVPVWMLLPFNPDWRWLIEREDSLWYPSARLFRQESWGDWDGVFARVARALREQSLRPLVQRVPVRLGLAELVERAVREQLQPDGREDSWIALRNTGLLDTPEVAQAAERLRSAHEEMATVGELMAAALESTADLDGQAAVLVRRYARARRLRSDTMARFANWLAGGGGPEQE
jgi:hypothetical protein